MNLRAILLDEIMAYPYALLVAGALIGGGFLAFELATGPQPEPKFSEGQIVELVAFGDRGMVIGKWCRHVGSTCRYNVRFSEPVRLVKDIREHELRAVQ